LLVVAMATASGGPTSTTSRTFDDGNNAADLASLLFQQQHSPLPANPWDSAGAVEPGASGMAQDAATIASNSQPPFVDAIRGPPLVPPPNNVAPAAATTEQDPLSSWLLQSSMSGSLDVSRSSSSHRHNNSSSMYLDVAQEESQRSDQASFGMLSTTTSLPAPPVVTTTIPPPPGLLPKPPPGFESLAAGTSVSNLNSNNNDTHSQDCMVSQTNELSDSYNDPLLGSNKSDLPSAMVPDQSASAAIAESSSEEPTPTTPEVDHKETVYDESSLSRASSSGDAVQEDLATKDPTSTAPSAKRKKKKSKATAVTTEATREASSLLEEQPQPVLQTQSNTQPPASADSATPIAPTTASSPPPAEESLIQAIWNVFWALLACLTPARAIAWVVQLYRAVVYPLRQSVWCLLKYLLVAGTAVSLLFQSAAQEAALGPLAARLFGTTTATMHEPPPQTVSLLCYAVLYLLPYVSDVLMSCMDCPHWTPHILTNLTLYALLSRLLSHPSNNSSSSIPNTSRRGGGGGKSTKSTGSSHSSSNSTTCITSSSYSAESQQHELCQRWLQLLRYAIPCALLLEGFGRSNAAVALAEAPVRLQIAYGLVLCHCHGCLSPVAWVGWSVQVLLAHYYCYYFVSSGGGGGGYGHQYLLDGLLSVVGLAFIRLVSTLHYEPSGNI